MTAEIRFDLIVVSFSSSSQTCMTIIMSFIIELAFFEMYINADLGPSIERLGASSRTEKCLCLPLFVSFSFKSLKHSLSY